MKKFFTIIALAILILVSFVAIAVSFSSLSKNKEQNKALATQIKQNGELKEKLAEIENTIKAYDDEDLSLNAEGERLGTEEARLQDEETALDGIKEELDKENKNIEEEENRLDAESKRLIKVRALLDETERNLLADETAWKKEKTLNEHNSDVTDANGQTPDPQPPTQNIPDKQDKNQDSSKKTKKERTELKEDKSKALSDRRTQLNSDKKKYNSNLKQYQTDRNNLNNSKQKYQADVNSYNIRHTRYEDDCLEFNQKNDAFKAEQSEHDRRSVDIQKLREEKVEIEQKISSFEKENPDIKAKYNEFQKTKSYLTMIVATFSFLLLILIILLVFVIVFKGGNRSQRPKNKAAEKTEPKLNTYIYKPEKTIENNEVKENSQGLLSRFFSGKKSHTKESEYGTSKQTQNISVDDTNHINANLEKRVKQLESDNSYLKSDNDCLNKRLDQLEKEIINRNNENKLFSENIKKIVLSLKELNKKVDKQTITQPKKSISHTYEENGSFNENSPPQGAIIDEYSDSMAREKYSNKSKKYLNVNINYVQDEFENYIGTSNSILIEHGDPDFDLFLLIEDRLYFNFYRYNENEPLSEQNNEGEIMNKIFNFEKDKYGRIKWCSPAIVELKNGNYVVEDKGSVWIEK